MMTDEMKKTYEEIQEKLREESKSALIPASENASYLLSGLIDRFEHLKLEILNRDDEASAKDVLQCLSMFNAHVVNTVVNPEWPCIDYILNELANSTIAAIKKSPCKMKV